MKGSLLMLNNLDHIKYDELIGKFVDVLSSDQSINGISGLVINETKNTIHVLHNNKTKIIPKSTCNFTFSGISESIDGQELLGLSYNRLSKVRKL